MSTQIFPVFQGLTFPVKRTPQFRSQIIEVASGKETRIALRSAPRYLYELSFEVLRQFASFSEYNQFLAFYNNMFGSFDTFQYSDPDDNSVTNQGIGIGDGVTTTFQLIRAVGAPGFSKWIDIILAPNIVSTIYFNGTPISSSTYAVSLWGTATPGKIVFTSPPGNNIAVTADFSWYWPCRFTEDSIELAKFANGFFSIDSCKFQTVY